MRRDWLAASVIVISLGGLFGCAEDDPVTPGVPDAPLDQQYVFESYYVNFAWGAVFNGKYIDGNGNVITYDHSHGYWNPANPDTLTAAELAERFSVVTDTLGRVDLAELNQASGLIAGASVGALSELERVAYDAGARRYQCYKYDPDHDHYVRVLLAQSGNFRQYNMSAEAEEILDWLNQIGWGRFDWLDEVRD